MPLPRCAGAPLRRSGQGQWKLLEPTLAGIVGFLLLFFLGALLRCNLKFLHLKRTVQRGLPRAVQISPRADIATT